ncbi:hypothetical protein ACT29H_01675 [Thermophagus sp. OGC60D27]|uniref:hypothetical protein n=1 Tax=Thermophagus sp. OGC60D27 TaxID=3458415 RepID=UPI004037E819
MPGITRIKKKSDDLTAEQLTGIAIGQMGLGLDTFLNMTPFEFAEAWQLWVKNKEHEERLAWERTRMQVFWTICPPQKKQITPYDINRFPWEREIKTPHDAPMSTQERFEMLKKKWNG